MTSAPVGSSNQGARALSLKIPGQAEYIGIARLAVSGLANQLDIPYDEAEDLKLAVTEACSHLLRSAASRVDLLVECRFAPDNLEIQVKSAPQGGDPLPVPGWSAASGDWDPELEIHLLEALMDRVAMETDDKTGAMAVSMARRLQGGV